MANSDSLTTEIEHVVTRYGWQAFTRCAETPDHFFLVAHGGVIVPKRGFTSPEDIDRFRDVVATSIASD